VSSVLDWPDGSGHFSGARLTAMMRDHGDVGDFLIRANPQ